jgi:EmrB/QacA subfamily drug resistance transporter
MPGRHQAEPGIAGTRINTLWYQAGPDSQHRFMTLSSAASQPQAERLSARALGMLLVLCGALFLDAMDVSMIGVALPSIRSDLGLSTSSLQWVVSAYVLGYGGFLLLGGRAADLFGRRRMFLISLAVFVVASALGGFANDGTLLIATRFVKGVSAAFTAPAGLSIITTSFAEGAARNKAISIYTATGATGFSLGLVFGGLLTEIGWRWVFFLPVPIALVTLLAAIRLVPAEERPEVQRSRSFDLAGAVSLTAAMLLLVFTVVEAPDVGWASARTLGSFAGVAAILAAFVLIEHRVAAPLVRLGILRSSPLVRANLAAMLLVGSWFGFQFIATLYMQQLRGWSPLETGLAIFPGGFLVAVLAPRVGPLVIRFGIQRLVTVGFLSAAAAYALFVPIGLDSGYAAAMLPTFVLAGFGFALSYGPLNIAGTNGVAPHEQGLASGLVSSSFQVGGAIVLAVATAVNNAAAGSGGSAQATLDGFHAAIVVSVIAAGLGAVITAVGRRPRAVPEEHVLEEALDEAA